MKWIVTILIVLTCFLCVSAEESILDKQLEIRQANLDTLTKTLEVGMDATIAYVEEIGGDASELESKKAAFLAKRETLRDASNHEILNAGVNELNEQLKSFNQLADSIVKGNPDGVPATWLLQVLAALKENEGPINDLKDEYWSIKQTNVLEIYDEQLAGINELADLIEASGWDMDQIDAKVSKLEELKTDLTDALDSKVELQVVAVQVKILGTATELVNVGAPGLVWAYSADIIQFWINVATAALDSIDKIITELDNQGLPTGDLREIHTGALGHLEDLEDAYDEKDVLKAQEALEDLEQDWIDFVQELNSLKPKVDAAYQQKLESVITALQENQQQLVQDKGELQ
ncbi:hypothetical protein ACFLZX_04705 [Nanoarchaeota archaeon]